MNNNNVINTNTVRGAGLMYLFIIAAGIFSQVFIRSSLMVRNDIAASAENILAQPLLYKFGFSLDLILIIFDVAIAVFFFFLFRPKSPGLALFAAVLRWIMVAISALNALKMMDAWIWLNAQDFAQGMDLAQLQTLAYQALKAHNWGYHIALVFFAAHCFSLGLLSLKTKLLPKVIGCLLIFAALAYWSNTAFALFAPQNHPGGLILLPALIAELSLAMYLVFKAPAISERASA